MNSWGLVKQIGPGKSTGLPGPTYKNAMAKTRVQPYPKQKPVSAVPRAVFKHRPQLVVNPQTKYAGARGKQFIIPNDPLQYGKRPEPLPPHYGKTVSSVDTALHYGQNVESGGNVLGAKPKSLDGESVSAKGSSSVKSVKSASSAKKSSVDAMPGTYPVTRGNVPQPGVAPGRGVRVPQPGVAPGHVQRKVEKIEKKVVRKRSTSSSGSSFGKTLTTRGRAAARAVPDRETRAEARKTAKVLEEARRTLRDSKRK